MSDSTSPKVPSSLRLVTPGTHPTRMAQVANTLASNPKASEDVRLLASMVRELCYQLDRTSCDARAARSITRRTF